jgi:hypothetical protein
MRRYGIAVGLAAFCATATVVAQQQPPAGTTPQRPAAQTEPATDQNSGATVTLIGCVYKEQDVAGRTPNVAERAGVLEDYILAQVEEKSASASGAAAVGTSGSTGRGSKMYKLELIADDRLQAMVGKRVEVTGKIDAEAGDTAGRATGTAGTAGQPDRSAGPDRVELPEFEVSSIKEVEGTCPANPSAK